MTQDKGVIKISLWLPWQLSIATRYVADAYCATETPYQIWTLYDLKQRTYWGFHSGCHGNWVTIATRYVADANCPKEPQCQTWTQYHPRQRSYQGFTLVAMATQLPKQRGMWLLLIMPRTSMPNMDLIQLKAKELHYNIDSWLNDSNVSIVCSKWLCAFHWYALVISVSSWN